MPSARHNVVTFLPIPDPSTHASADPNKRIALTLEGPWKLSAGLRPDVNRAIVPYTEFDKLGIGGGNADLNGAIEFWYTSAPTPAGKPDVRLFNWRIVDVEAGQIAIPVGAVGNSPRVVEYRLFFADFREQFVEPRGGRLRVGLLNAGPRPLTQGLAAGNLSSSTSVGPVGAADSTGAQPAATVIPEWSLSQLMTECLNRMGYAKPLLPPGLDAIAAPRDLKWFGNHAPTELAKLLEMASAVFCPLFDGTGQVRLITTKGDPKITAADAIMPQIKVPAIDRRGKTVVFSSYPLSTTVTQVLQGPRADQWYFVLQDSQGKWQSLDKCDLVNQSGGLLGHWQTQFQNIPEQFRQRVMAQAYKFLQLGDANPANTGLTNNNTPAPSRPAGQISPVFTRRIESDGSLQDLEVTGKIARWDATQQQWINSTGQMRIPCQFKADNNIIQLAAAVIQVTNPTNDLFGDAREVKFGDITVRFTTNNYVQDSQGTWRPDYLHVGFQQQAGKIMQLDPDTVQNLLDSNSSAHDVIFVDRPELRLRIVTDNPRNRDQIIASAASLAAQYLVRSGDPMRIIQAQGFAFCAIDGLVSQVEWDQQRCLTTVTINDWYRPGGALDGPTLLKAERSGPGGGGIAMAQAYANQMIVQEQRNMLGEPGATTPTEAVNPYQIPVLPTGGPSIVQIGGNGSGAGLFNGTLYQGKPSIDGVSDLSMPAGLTAGQACIVADVEEGIDLGNKSGQHTLMPGSWAEVAFLGRTTGQNPQPLALVRGGTGNQANPTIIDPSPNGLSSDSTLWYRSGIGQAGEGQAIAGPFKIYFVTRVAWDSTNGILYQFQRGMSFDARGVAFRLGPEERSVIDTLTACA